MWRITLAREAQKAITQGDSLGEFWETVGAKDHGIKRTDVKDHRVKEGIDCLSHGQPMEREDKDSAPSAEEALRKC